MATDRDEQHRQQQELDEIRRSFAEMGARMGSMFEPAESDEAERSHQPPLLPPAPPVAAPSPLGIPARARWWWAAALVLLFVAGTAFGYILSGGDGGSAPSSAGAATATTRARATAPRPPATVTKTSVPETCKETAELADEVISRLTRNIRDNRLAEVLRDYTIASQACRREASS